MRQAQVRAQVCHCSCNQMRHDAIYRNYDQWQGVNMDLYSSQRSLNVRSDLSAHRIFCGGKLLLPREKRHRVDPC